MTCTPDHEFQRLKERIGKNISMLRNANRVSQERLCEHIGKSQPMLSKYENGSAMINLDTLYKICHFFGFPIDMILKKELTLEDILIINESGENLSKRSDTPALFDKDIYIYYMSTSYPAKIIEAPFVLVSPEDGGYISYLFEVKQNNPDNQLYDGKLVLGKNHAYFYFNNRNRGERGLIITYYYPQKNKMDSLGLLGLMISLSHGAEQRPCTQKCILSSKKLNVDSVDLKVFLNLEYYDDATVNTESIKYLAKLSDQEVYQWIKSL